MYLKTTPWPADPEARYVADVTQVTYQDPGLGSNSNYIVFTHVADQRTWPAVPWTVFSFDTLEVFGKVYQDVMLSERDNLPTKLYFNYDVGIVAFTEATGKVWRFDRFE